MYKFTLQTRDTDEVNLLDPFSWTAGFRLDETTGEIVAADGYYVSGFMPISYGSKYAYYCAGGYEVTFPDSLAVRFNSSKVKVGGNLVVAETVRGFTADVTSYYYIRFSIKVGSLDFDPNNVRLRKYTTVDLPDIEDFPLYYTDRVVNPIYSKLSRKFSKKAPDYYFLDELVGKLKLIRDDYDYVDSLAFSTKFFLLVQDLSGGFKDYLGYFYKTDCEWDADDRKVELKVKTQDDYVQMVGAMNKRFNLIDLAPDLEEIQITKRPLIQVYAAGDNVVTNVMGGNYWEQELQIDPVTDDSTLVNTYKFYNAQNMNFIPDSYAAGLSTDVTGDYDSAGLSDNGLYQLQSETQAVGGFGREQIRYYIERVSDTVRLYETYWIYTFNAISVYANKFRGVGGETGEFFYTAYRLYVRFMSDLVTYQSSELAPVPDNDIVANNSNYPRVIGFNTGEIFLSSDGTSTEPTQYGKFPDDSDNAGFYYEKLVLSAVTGLGNPIPISYSNWKSVSLWMVTDSTGFRATEFQGGSVFNIRDTFPLHAVIQKLIDASGVNLTFLNTEEYSEFLYSATNPMSGGFSYLDFDGSGLPGTNEYAGNLNLNLIPKTNIITSLYSSAAKKAEISLQDVLDALDSIYKLKWHISDGKLRLEHVYWYQQGGTYDFSANIGLDATETINLKNGKPWSFNSNKWSYDKNEMPERFEFSWMDDVSPAFEGYPITIESKLVEEGRVEDESVGLITTDLDYVMASPQEISKNGFVLVNTVDYDGDKRVPFTLRDLASNEEVIMQNGFLSWLYLHPTFHIYNLPAYEAIINNELVYLYSNTTRTKKQPFKVPVSGSIDPYELIKTNLGTGEIEDIDIDMQSLIATISVKHDLEE